MKKSFWPLALAMTAISLFFIFSDVFAFNPGDIVISEVQITGGAGKTTNDYVKIFNKTSEKFNLKDWRLVKRTKVGTKDSTVYEWVNDEYIDPFSYYIWANNDNSGFAESISANCASSTSISDDNGIALRYGAENTGSIIDSVAWGAATNIFVETLAFPKNPGANKQIRRIFSTTTNAYTTDTNNNAIDFEPWPVTETSSSTTSTNENTNTTTATTTATTTVNQTAAAGGGNDLSEAEKRLYDFSSDILLTEILPNPLDADLVCVTSTKQCEFIEIYNNGSRAINLLGWKIGAGEQKYEIKQALILNPKEYYVFWRAETKLSLPNDEGKIDLFEPLAKTAKQTVRYSTANLADYGSAPEDISYTLATTSDQLALINRWQWSASKTPGQDNVITKVNYAPSAVFSLPTQAIVNTRLLFDGSDSFDPNNDGLKYFWDLGDQTKSVTLYLNHSYAKIGSYHVKLTVSDGQTSSSFTKTIKIVAPINANLTVAPVKTAVAVKKTVSAVKSMVCVKGAVTVLPGSFSEQYFYLKLNTPLTSDDATIKTLEIYNSKKQFPQLAIGNQVQVCGEFKILTTGPRLNAADQTQIKVLNPGQKLAALATDSEKIVEQNGELVSASGELTAKKGSTLYLDDGIGEFQVYLKRAADISTANFAVGDKLAVTGLALANDKGVQLLPREKKDIIKIADSANDLLAGATTSPISLPARDNSGELLKYLVIILGAAIVCLVVYVIKLKKGGK